MTCQNCTHANRESKVMLERGYIRCAIARFPTYKSVSLEQECRYFKKSENIALPPLLTLVPKK